MKKNILIYRIGQLGDTLVALPAIYEIISKHNNCNFILLTDRYTNGHSYVSSWDIISPMNIIDEVIFYDPKDLNFFEKLYQFLQLIRYLSNLNFQFTYTLVQRTNKLSLLRDFIFFTLIAGKGNYVSLPMLRYPPPKFNGIISKIQPVWDKLILVVNSKYKYKHKFSLSIPDHAKSEVSEVFKQHSDINNKKLIL